MGSNDRDGRPDPADDDVGDDAEVRDVLPEDLDITALVGPYVFPNNSRRRIPGILYLVLALLCIGTWLVFAGDDQPLVNGGFLGAGIGLGAVGVYSLVAGWDLRVDETDALVAATRAVGFPVGHASAQMGWRGLLSRPTWRILLYSNEPQPAKRGLVLVDGIDGEVLDQIVEDNPEDWAELGLR